MNLLPKASGNRPRIACEISQGAVVAGRSPEPGLPLSHVGRVDLPAGAIVPSLKPGNIADRVAVIAALRRALEQASGRASVRNAEMTLVIPDAAVRVLLLDFDALPGKLSEALPIVRFRLKKLLPFDADEAMVSFQVMSTSRSMIRVLAVAVPRDVLAEYESVTREAGFEPGAVLPSTLAALAGLEEGEGASLVVNAHTLGVTTAIVRAGIILLHRTLELAEYAAPSPANLPPALFERSATASSGLLPLVDRDTSEAEWAAQQPLPEHGRNPYADRLATEAVTQNQDAIPGYAGPNGTPGAAGAGGYIPRGTPTFDMYASEEAPVSRSPYASPTLQAELDANFYNAAYVAPLAGEPGMESQPATTPRRSFAPQREDEQPEPYAHALGPDAQAEEIARAVSVAVAYFEDSLAAAPPVLLNAGPLGAEALQRTLQEQGLSFEDGLRVRELVEPSTLAAAAATAAVPRGWLAGVVGALKS